MRGLLRGALIVVGGLLALTTMTRVQVWQGGEEALWAEATRRSPAKPRPWINLGKRYQIRGDLVAAAAAYRIGLDRAASPKRTADEQRLGRTLATYNLATALIQGQRWDEARVLVATLRQRYPSWSAVGMLEHSLPPQE